MNLEQNTQPVCTTSRPQPIQPVTAPEANACTAAVRVAPDSACCALSCESCMHFKKYYVIRACIQAARQIKKKDPPTARSIARSIDAFFKYKYTKLLPSFPHVLSVRIFLNRRRGGRRRRSKRRRRGGGAGGVQEVGEFYCCRSSNITTQQGRTNGATSTTQTGLLSTGRGSGKGELGEKTGSTLTQDTPVTERDMHVDRATPAVEQSNYCLKPCGLPMIDDVLQAWVGS